MFSRNLSNITLTNDLAEQAFGNVCGDSYNGDTSFVATLRALLLSRVGTNSVRLFYKSVNLSRSSIERASFDELINYSMRRLGPDRITVCNLNSVSQGDRQAFLDRFDNAESGFVKIYPDFVELTNIRDFVQSAMNARFYTSEERKSTIIIVENMNIKRWHYIQSFTPRYFKWYFENAPYTEEEKHLLASLTMRSPDEYQRRIEEFANRFDMRAILIQNVIGGFESNARRAQLERIDSEIRDTLNTMRSLMEDYSYQVRSLDEKNLIRSGLQQAIDTAGSSSELVDFFKANKSLEPIRTDGYVLEFIVKTYLDGFDPEMYETMSNREESHIYRGYDIYKEVFRDKANRKKFLDAIFSDDPKLRIKTCAYYRIDMRGTVNSQSRYSYPESCRDMIPNPHLQRHNCLGNHRQFIQERLQESDIVGAIGQCIASAKSVNVGESATFPYFLGELFETNYKVIELPDGSSVSPEEAFKWLLDQEVSAHTEVHEDV